jgi:hypothetical protein
MSKGNGFAEQYQAAKDATAKMAVRERLPIFAVSRNLGDAVCGASIPGGGSISPCKVTLFTEGGKVKLAVNDTTRSKVAFVTLDANLGLAEAIEEALGSDRLDWRDAPKRDQGGWKGPR